jgi:hypothetical protein
MQYKLVCENLTNMLCYVRFIFISPLSNWKFVFVALSLNCNLNLSMKSNSLNFVLHGFFKRMSTLKSLIMMIGKCLK